MSSHGSPGAGAAWGAGFAVLRMRAAAVNAAGGPARARVALTLAAVLAVNGADVGTVSATMGNLERAFGVGNTLIGLLHCRKRLSVRAPGPGRGRAAPASGAGQRPG
jgi:hypothetical protein